MNFSQLKQNIMAIAQRAIVVWLAIVVLLVLLLWLLVSGVQEIWFAPKPLMPTVVGTPISQGPAASVIPSLHLFGSSATDLKNLPLASLGLQVQGIFLNADAKQSRVLISMTGQASQIYNIGDMLPGNVKIFKITRDSVVVSHDNQLEKLPFALQGIDFSDVNTDRGLFG